MAILAGEADETCGGGLVGEPFQHVGQSWDCLRVENELEERERDAIDWLVDDKMMRQREAVSKDEEDITVKRSEGGKLQVEKVQSALELVVAQTQMKNMEVGKEKKRNISDWCKKMLEEIGEQTGLRGHGGNATVETSQPGGY